MFRPDNRSLLICYIASGRKAFDSFDLDMLNLAACVGRGVQAPMMPPIGDKLQSL